MTVGRSIRMASPVGPKSSRRCGRLCARSGHDARPHVAAAGEVHGDDGQHCGEHDDRHQGEGLGRGEGPELLHPTERGHPDEAVQAHARVGDHPHGVG